MCKNTQEVSDGGSGSRWSVGCESTRKEIDGVIQLTIRLERTDERPWC
jgi:hypothetical protein